MADTNEKAKALREQVVSSLVASLDGGAEETESPIEELLYWALLAASLPFGRPTVECLREYGMAPWFQVETNTDPIVFYPQHEVTIGEATYRLDFYAWTITEAPTVTGDTQRLLVEAAIECDGHDFHERTKEQAKRDRQRDRALQSAGYLVLRFTGSEIYRGPEVVATEIVSSLERAVRAKFSAAHDAWTQAGKGVK